MASAKSSVSRDSCYFCTSVFQLFSILSLALERGEKADLYIDPQFSKAEEYAERIRGTKIFEEVFVMDSRRIYDMYISRESGLINHLQIARTYLHVKKISKILVPEDHTYRNIFVSSRAFIPRLYILSRFKMKCDVCVYYFDDGIGSYYGNAAIQPSKADGLFRKAIFGKKAVDFDHDRFMLSPELYRRINGKTPYQVLKVDPFWNKNDGDALLDQVFPCEGDHELKESAVILEELSDEFFDAQNLQRLNETYEYTRQQIDRDDLLVKCHPRSKGGKREGFNYYRNFGLPFEILCMKNDMDRRVLITCASTAVVTPKMIMDHEPYVILLYRFIRNEGMNQEVIANFFNSFRDIYRDKEKVMIPESLEEFKSCLDKVKKEIRK